MMRELHLYPCRNPNCKTAFVYAYTRKATTPQVCRACGKECPEMKVYSAR